MHTQIQHRSVLDHPWRIAALVAVVFNVTYNYVNEMLGDHARNVAQISHANPSLFAPADYAFAIWGVIYGATLLYAVMALLPSQHGVEMHDRVAPWLVATNALASLWIALFTAEQLGPSVLIILAMLTASGFMYAIANEHLVKEKLSRWWRVPFALWVSWLSVATIANVSLALAATGWDGSPLSAPVWAALMLCVAAAVGLGLNIAYRDPVVPLVIAWASAAIAVARWEDSTLVAVVAMLVALKSALWAGSTLLFQNYPIPPKIYRRRPARPPPPPQRHQAVSTHGSARTRGSSVRLENTSRKGAAHSQLACRSSRSVAGPSRATAPHPTVAAPSNAVSPAPARRRPVTSRSASVPCPTLITTPARQRAVTSRSPAPTQQRPAQPRHPRQRGSSPPHPTVSPAPARQLTAPPHRVTRASAAAHRVTRASAATPHRSHPGALSVLITAQARRRSIHPDHHRADAPSHRGHHPADHRAGAADSRSAQPT